MLEKFCLNDVGRTTLHQVNSIDVDGNKIFGKCEFLNPTGSHKDRTFLHMVNALERKAVIEPGMTLIDCSTGNGGAALAWVGREKGYDVVIFMPEGMTEERTAQIRGLGAEIVETDRDLFLNGSVEAAEEFVQLNREQGYYFLNQGSSLLNKEAWHQCGTEIVSQFRRLDTEPDYFICSIGTGGTFSGIAEVLKREFPRIHTVGIEVDRSAPLYAKKNCLEFEHHPHNLMGLRGGVLSVNTNESVIDEICVVDGAAAWNRMKQFIAEEDMGIGPTCGANLLMCEFYAEKLSDKNILTLFFDSSWKYQSRWSGIYPEYVAKVRA